jgi:hypothetical protein
MQQAAQLGLHDPVLASLDRLIAHNETEARTVRTRLEQLERAPWRSEKMRLLAASGLLSQAEPAQPDPPQEETSSQLSKELLHAQAKIERLERKLAETTAELRLCQTQLYAYEREIRALLEENTEQEAELDAARQLGFGVDEPPEAPELPELPELPDAEPLLHLTPDEEAVAEPMSRLPRAPVAAQRTPVRYMQSSPKGIPPTALEQMAAPLVDRMGGMA